MGNHPTWLRASLVVLCLAVTSGVAQYALDASLSSTSRVNARRAAPAMNRPIYTVSRASGTMVYNRANAFNDSVYSIHQRYTHDRFENFTPAGTATALTVGRSQRKNIGGSFSAMPEYRPAVVSRPQRQTVTRRYSKPIRRSSSSNAETRSRTSTSVWNMPAESLVYRGHSTGSYVSQTPTHGLGNGATTFATGAVPLPELSKPIVRPQGYSVASDEIWSWR